MSTRRPCPNGTLWSLANFAAAAACACLAMALTSCEPAKQPAPVKPVPAAPAVDPLSADEHAVAVEAPDGAGEVKYPTGYTPDPQAVERFMEENPGSEFKDAAPHFFARGPPDEAAAADDKPIVLTDYLLKVVPAFVVERQLIGDCVSHGHANGVNVLSAVELVQGTSGKWFRVASEPIYGGARSQISNNGRPAGYRDGSYGGAAVKWLRDYGVLFRQKYGDVDLSTYDSRRAKEYGNSGCPKALEGVARQHPVKTVALVTTWDELVAAIKNGYPVTVCSGQGFTSTRDKNGFARASGSWSHCMLIVGVRFDIEGGCILNSWGPDWIGGPKALNQLDGSFWAERRTIERMLAGRDSWALSAYVGFPARKLRNAEGWSREHRAAAGFLSEPVAGRDALILRNATARDWLSPVRPRLPLFLEVSYESESDRDRRAGSAGDLGPGARAGVIQRQASPEAARGAADQGDRRAAAAFDGGRPAGRRGPSRAGQSPRLGRAAVA